MAHRSISSRIHLILITGTLVSSAVLDSCEISDSITLSGESSHGIVITSPNYPDNYPNSVYVCWAVTSTAGSVVTMVVQSYDTEAAYDHVDIYDGLSSSTNRLDRLSGTGSNVTFLTSGPSMYITFISDDSVNYNGFKGCVCASGHTACVCDWSEFDSEYYNQSDGRNNSEREIPTAAYYSIGFVALVVFVSIFLGIRYGMYSSNRRQIGRRTPRDLLGNNRVSPASPSVAVIHTPPVPPSYEASRTCPRPAVQPGFAPLDPPPAYPDPQSRKISTSSFWTRIRTAPVQTELYPDRRADPNVQTELYPNRRVDPNVQTELCPDRRADPNVQTYPDRRADPNVQTELYTDSRADPNVQTDLYIDRRADPNVQTYLYTDRRADPVHPTFPSNPPPSYQEALSS